MAFDYQRSSIHRSYDAARSLPPETIELWMSIIQRHASSLEVRTVCDVGSGTGRFTAALARGFNAVVHAVEPSANMLTVARENLSAGTSIGTSAGASAGASTDSAERVHLHRAPAEALPLPDASCELVFMSQAYHHLDDPGQALAEMRRVLRPQGMVFIRQATRENLAGVPLFACFPEALALEQQRLPARTDVIGELTTAGFAAVGWETVEQVTAADYREYCSKVSHRGVSVLRLIGDEEFQRGLERLRESLGPHLDEGPVRESFDLFRGSRP